MKKEQRNGLPDPDVRAVMLNLGFNEEAVLMSCHRFEGRRFLYYAELNRIWEEKRRRPYDAHSLVMDLLQCDSNAAWHHLAVNGFV